MFRFDTLGAAGKTLLAASAAALCALPAAAGGMAKEKPMTGEAAFIDAQGEDAGTASLVQTPNGVLLTAQIKRLTPGAHAFHIHSVGKCTPDFSAAGGHFAPDGHIHGFAEPGGPHAGDLPNIYADNDGLASVELFLTNVTLEKGKHSLFDADGSALVVHAEGDSYLEDADAGARVACAVIVPAP